MRKDVFDKVMIAEKKLGSTLPPEAKRFAERLIKLGKRNGKLYMHQCHFKQYITVYKLLLIYF